MGHAHPTTHPALGVGMWSVWTFGLTTSNVSASAVASVMSSTKSASSPAASAVGTAQTATTSHGASAHGGVWWRQDVTDRHPQTHKEFCNQKFFLFFLETDFCL